MRNCNRNRPEICGRGHTCDAWIEFNTCDAPLVIQTTLSPSLTPMLAPFGNHISNKPSYPIHHYTTTCLFYIKCPDSNWCYVIVPVEECGPRAERVSDSLRISATRDVLSHWTWTYNHQEMYKHHMNILPPRISVIIHIELPMLPTQSTQSVHTAV